eukprot:618600-Lingulodinium_polyedra.AAC.1
MHAGAPRVEYQAQRAGLREDEEDASLLNRWAQLCHPAIQQNAEELAVRGAASGEHGAHGE